MLESTNFERPELDSNHGEYLFAGALLGSAWTFENGLTRTVNTVRRDASHTQGDSDRYPVLVFDTGRPERVISFLEEIHKGDESIQPANTIAEQIYSHLKN
jgi:hypothetical protein